MNKEKNGKLALQLGITVTIILAIGFFVLWKIVDVNTSGMVQEQITNQMTDAVESRAAIINEYVDTAEDHLVAFAKGDEVRNILLHPESKEALERAQQYTVDFAKVKGYFEGLYIASTETYVYTHTSEGSIGITTRKGDALKELQNTMMTKDEIYTSGIMLSPGSGNLVLAMYYPVFDQGKCIGFVGAAVLASDLMDSLLDLDIKGLPESEYAFLDEKAGTYLYNADEALVNTEIENQGYLQILKEVEGETSAVAGIKTYVNENGVSEMIAYKYIPERHWVFAVKDKEANVLLPVEKIRNITGIVCLVTGTIIVIIILLVVSTIGGKLYAIEKAIKKLGNMDLNSDFGLKRYEDDNNEIGSICKAVSQTSKQLISYIGEVNLQLEAMANGDFTRELNAQVEFKGEFIELQRSLNKIQRTLRESFAEIETVTQQLALGAQTVSNSATCLADAATHENILVMEIDEHVGDISVQVSDSTQNAISAKKLTAQAAELVNISNQKMEELTKAMDNIAVSAKAIGGLSGNLEDIAKQTNILSLNALVEANRVGEAGRSFGVVANEIRDLAEESDEAARNAYELISQTIEAIELGAKLTQETAECLYQVVSQTKTIDQAVSDIAEASKQQNDKLSAIKNKLEDIGKAVETTAAMAEQEAAASNELDSQANVLEENLKQYRV